jgi:hypothetical protein
MSAEEFSCLINSIWASFSVGIGNVGKDVTIKVMKVKNSKLSLYELAQKDGYVLFSDLELS